jgi:glycosyltransferase involved in cell wall biosynthesis
VILIGFMPNPRIFKRAALESEMYEVHIICWNRGDNMIEHRKTENCILHEIKIDASNDPLKRLVPYYRFRSEALRLIKEINPCIIHAQMVDMLKIAIKYNKHKKKKAKLIYEIADLHRLLVDKQTNPLKKAMQIYLRKADRRCCKKINLLIVTSNKYYDMYFKAFVPKNIVLYFPNVPDLSAFKSYKKHCGSGESFTVGFIGGIRYKQQCEILIDATKKLDMPLLFAGFENGKPEIETKCKEYKKCEWVGGFDYKSQIAQLYGKCDVVYSVYDADMANVRVALPNKIYEAVYCEIPIIGAKNTYLSELISEWGIGESVDYKVSEDLTCVLQRMRDDRAYYNSLVKNCSNHKDEIDLEKYNKQLKNIIEKMVE